MREGLAFAFGAASLAIWVAAYAYIRRAADSRILLRRFVESLGIPAIGLSVSCLVLRGVAGWPYLCLIALGIALAGAAAFRLRPAAQSPDVFAGNGDDVAAR